MPCRAVPSRAWLRAESGTVYPQIKHLSIRPVVISADFPRKTHRNETLHLLLVKKMLRLKTWALWWLIRTITQIVFSSRILVPWGAPNHNEAASVNILLRYPSLKFLFVWDSLCDLLFFFMEICCFWYCEIFLHEWSKDF